MKILGEKHEEGGKKKPNPNEEYKLRFSEYKRKKESTSFETADGKPISVKGKEGQEPVLTIILTGKRDTHGGWVVVRTTSKKRLKNLGVAPRREGSSEKGKGGSLSRKDVS